MALILTSIYSDMKPKMTISGDAATITGTLTVKFHAEIYGVLQKAMREVNHIVIQTPESIDLCGLQLLWACYHLAKINGRTLTLELHLQEADEKLLQRTGFKHLANSIH
jgi:hypothetical protein